MCVFPYVFCVHVVNYSKLEVIMMILYDDDLMSEWPYANLMCNVQRTFINPGFEHFCVHFMVIDTFWHY